MNPETEIAHEELVARLVKRPIDILTTLDIVKVDLVHMALGVAGEAGELVDAIKKYAIYNKPLDKKNVIEELGDLEFYMRRIRAQLSITREEVLLENIAKLSLRYGHNYSDQAAINRADKA